MEIWREYDKVVRVWHIVFVLLLLLPAGSMLLLMLIMVLTGAVSIDELYGDGEFFLVLLPLLFLTALLLLVFIPALVRLRGVRRRIRQLADYSLQLPPQYQENFLKEARRLHAQNGLQTGELGLWITAIKRFPNVRYPIFLPYGQVGWAYARSTMLQVGNPVEPTAPPLVRVYDIYGQRFFVFTKQSPFVVQGLLRELAERSPTAVVGYTKEWAALAKTDFQALLRLRQQGHMHNSY